MERQAIMKEQSLIQEDYTNHYFNQIVLNMNRAQSKVSKIENDIYYHWKVEKASRILPFSMFVNQRWLFLKKNKTLGYVNQMEFPLNSHPKLKRQRQLSQIKEIHLNSNSLRIQFNDEAQEQDWIFYFKEGEYFTMKWSNLILKSKQRCTKQLKSSKISDDRTYVKNDNCKDSSYLNNQEENIKTKRKNQKEFIKYLKQIDQQSNCEFDMIITTKKNISSDCLADVCPTKKLIYDQNQEQASSNSSKSSNEEVKHLQNNNKILRELISKQQSEFKILSRKYAQMQLKLQIQQKQMQQLRNYKQLVESTFGDMMHQ